MYEKLEEKNINKKKNIEVNDIKSNIDCLKKDSIKSNPFLKNLTLLENSPLFDKIKLKKEEVLFNQWDIDWNLYLIKKWLVCVEKSIWEDRFKNLANLKTWDFFWEWWFSKNLLPKDVRIKSLANTELLKIDVKNSFSKFIEEFPNIWFEILSYIIWETNQRLLDINKLFTSSSQMEILVNKLKEVNQKAIFSLIDEIKKIVDSEYILYFEKSLVMSDVLTLRYDSRTPSKMLDIIFEKDWYFIDLDELYEKANIWKNDSIIINKISIWEEVYWYIILGRERRIFNENDKRVVSWISNSLAWVIKKFIQDKENKNKIYVNEMKNV